MDSSQLINDVKTVADEIGNNLVEMKKLEQNNKNDDVHDVTSSCAAGSRINHDEVIDAHAYSLNAENTITNKLYHDCMVKIFMHLPLVDRLEVEKVCQKWEEWSKMSWFDVKKIFPDDLMIENIKKEKLLKKILKRSRQYLTHLKIVDQYSWMPDLLTNQCQNIIHLDIDMNIHGYKIPLTDLLQMILSMSKLKYLSVDMDSSVPTDFFTDNEILAQLPETMEEIHLFAESPPQVFSPVLPDKFNGLRRLTLTSFLLTNATLESINLKKNSLVELNLSFCHFPSDSVSIFSSLSNLEHLELCDVNNFNNNAISEFAHNCPKLKYLELSGMKDDFIVPYRFFHELRYLKNLESLFFPRVDTSEDFERSILNVVKNFKKLKELGVGYGANFSMADIQEITQLKKLRMLDLSITKIDSQSLIDIASNCLELEQLLMKYDNMSESALEKLSNLKKLTSLRFSHCKNLTENVSIKIADNCKNLVDLMIHACDFSLSQVGKFKNLKRLNISCFCNVPTAMFNDLYNLEELSCTRCPNVTDENIMKVLDNCLNLTTLEVSETGVTVKTLEHASKRPFAFKTLTIIIDESDDNEEYDGDYVKFPFLHIIFS